MISDTQPQQSPILDSNGACAYANISKSTMYKLIAKGEFATRVRIGRNKIGFFVNDINTWLESRKGV